MINLKVDKGKLICGIVILLQLFWMQTGILLPTINGSLYQIIYYMKYLGTGIMVIYLLSRPVSKNKILEFKKYIRYLIPIFLGIFLIEVVAIISSPIVDYYGIAYFTRAFAQILDKICILLMIGCIWVVAHENTIEFLTNIFIIDELILFIVEVPRVGIGRIIQPLFSGFGIQNEMSSALEVHEITYCLGFCLIYYLFFKTNKRQFDKFKIITIIAFILLGGKRVAILGILISGLFCFFVYKRGIRKINLAIIGIAVAIISFAYLLILYNGSLFDELNLFNINSMGRDVIYQYFISRSSFSPSFWGYGIAAVSKMIENWTKADVGNMVNVRGLHNDILKLYVDLGFWGMIYWLVFYYIYFPIKLFNKMGKKTATFYMALALYAFITYMTDNTEGYFVFQTTLFAFPLGYYTSIQNKVG